MEELWKELMTINPWHYENSESDATLFLGYDDQNKRHAVVVLRTYWDGGWPDEEPPRHKGESFYFGGDSPLEAIQTALRAAKERKYAD